MAAPDPAPSLAAGLAVRIDAGTLELVLRDRIAPHDVRPICDGVRARLLRRTELELECRFASAGRPDLATLDLVARLTLMARQLGRPFTISGELAGLLELTSLAGLDAIVPGSGLDPGRECKQREEALRVEEERDPADPPA